MSDDQYGTINIDQLLRQWNGTKYCDFLIHHLAKRAAWKDGHLQLGIKGTMNLLPEAIQEPAQSAIEELVAKILAEPLRTIETNQVFLHVSTATSHLFEQHGSTASEEDIFNVFQIVTLKILDRVIHDETLKHVIMPATRIPFGSMAALLYPISAFVFISTTPAPVTVRVAYGISQLGYLLIAASTLVGSFRVFGLRNRKHTLIAGIAVLMTGIILGNL